MTRHLVANEDTSLIRLFIVRHGQTDHNVQKILQGQLDVDLNDTGINQAKMLGQGFSGIALDKIYCSDLVRCVNTVKEVQHYHPDVKVKYTSDLRERYMGEEVQGMPIKDAMDKYGKDYSLFGESREQLIYRVEREWTEILTESKKEGFTNVMLCSHGGVIRGFMRFLSKKDNVKLGPGLDDIEIRVPFNTSVTLIDVDRITNASEIVFFGDTSHLGEQLEVKDQRVR